ncbi:polar amino acid transport system substrate-binding protein [Colwellia chukchiensis]|uniref:Polar amino acid transport system substrate-binding protein n=1 Tax=Colwellia chukchiensis TaxID=641665 RepID=A0A1H7R5E1_9GAMM|nr:hypothetical protein [Colwellia chukchiensis]SEL55349.1 polar amino acid transport system substrate-binding protein [Colwellia chukchiensis]
MIIAFNRQAYANQISIASDIWCPYICTDSQQPGYVVEMINAILIDNELSPLNQTMPLARAIKYLQQNNIDLVLGLTKQHIDYYQLVSSKLSVGITNNDFLLPKVILGVLVLLNNLPNTLKTAIKSGL